MIVGVVVITGQRDGNGGVGGRVRRASPLRHQLQVGVVGAIEIVKLFTSLVLSSSISSPELWTPLALAL